VLKLSGYMLDCGRSILNRCGPSGVRNGRTRGKGVLVYLRAKKRWLSVVDIARAEGTADWRILRVGEYLLASAWSVLCRFKRSSVRTGGGKRERSVCCAEVACWW